jgi:hypothetical protein
MKRGKRLLCTLFQREPQPCRPASQLSAPQVGRHFGLFRSLQIYLRDQETVGVAIGQDTDLDSVILNCQSRAPYLVSDSLPFDVCFYDITRQEAERKVRHAATLVGASCQ